MQINNFRLRGFFPVSLTKLAEVAASEKKNYVTYSKSLIQYG